ncbi:hypothetical protein ACFL26_02165 [Patescibacteria group bacterium]
MQPIADIALARIGGLPNAALPVAADLAARPARSATADADRHEAAAEAIRRLADAPELAVTYLSSERDPYDDDDSDRRLDVYADDGGYEYRVDPDTCSVMQMGRREDSDPPTHAARPDERLPVADLRQAALGIVERQIPGFERLLSSLHPLEANDRREVYYFRWEDLSEPLSESELPPFVQVGLLPNGSISSFTDTLTRHVRSVPGEHEGCDYPPSSWTKA